nr:hypothetical protein [Candidatus Sigynarchaeota archaeon]
MNHPKHLEHGASVRETEEIDKQAIVIEWTPTMRRRMAQIADHLAIDPLGIITLKDGGTFHQEVLLQQIKNDFPETHIDENALVEVVREMLKFRAVLTDKEAKKPVIPDSLSDLDRGLCRSVYAWFADTNMVKHAVIRAGVETETYTMMPEKALSDSLSARGGDGRSLYAIFAEAYDSVCKLLRGGFPGHIHGMELTKEGIVFQPVAKYLDGIEPHLRLHDGPGDHPLQVSHLLVDPVDAEPWARKMLHDAGRKVHVQKTCFFQVGEAEVIAPDVRPHVVEASLKIPVIGRNADVPDVPLLVHDPRVGFFGFLVAG